MFQSLTQSFSRRGRSSRSQRYKLGGRNTGNQEQEQEEAAAAAAEEAEHELAKAFSLYERYTVGEDPESVLSVAEQFGVEARAVCKLNNNPFMFDIDSFASAYFLPVLTVKKFTASK